YDTGFSTDPKEVFAELALASKGGPADYSGITYERLDAGEEIFWPCPDREGVPHPGTPRMFLDGFNTSDGRARMVPVDHHPPADDLRPDAPIYLITGRVLQHYQSGAQTRRVESLNAAQPSPYVEMHPLLAQRLGLEAGAMVEIESARGII